MTAARMHLQGIGDYPAIPAGDLVVGDVLTWNYGYRYEITSITPCGKQSVKVTEKSLADGTEYTRTMRRTRLVVADRIPSGLKVTPVGQGLKGYE